jgi:tetratricopeptide (TPR) repeat protein
MKSISLVVTVMVLFLLAGGPPAFGQDVKALEAQGIELCNDGKFDQAIATFTQGLKQKPDDPTLSYLRGKAYYAKRQDNQALEDFNTAIKLKPDYGQAYFGRALVLVDQENFDEALEDLHKAEMNGYKDADFLSLVRKKAKQKPKP